MGLAWRAEGWTRGSNVITEGLCKNLNSNVVDVGEFSCYLLSVELEAWFISLLEMKLRISEKYESSFSSKSAWLSGSEFGEEMVVPRLESIPDCWLTVERKRADIHTRHTTKHTRLISLMIIRHPVINELMKKMQNIMRLVLHVVQIINIFKYLHFPEWYGASG